MVSLYEAQKKIYPRSVSGLFSRWRWFFVWATQLVFYGLPWLEWGQRQAVLFDLDARRFYIFKIAVFHQIRGAQDILSAYDRRLAHR